MRQGPEPIGDIVAELMARRGLGRVQSSAALEAAWRQAAGELLACYSRPGPIRRHTLDVVVTNSVVLQEMTFQKTALLNRLASLLPDCGIRDLRFRLGTIQ